VLVNLGPMDPIIVANLVRHAFTPDGGEVQVTALKKGQKGHFGILKEKHEGNMRVRG
jgi:hypothetical protein